MMSNERGNVLFLILIAVALFAALTYAVSHNGRNQNPMNRESTKLQATQIMTFGNRVKTAIDRLRISGCAENQLDFGNTIWTRVNGATYNVPVGHNSNAPVGGECNIFHFNGLSEPVVTFPKASVHPSRLPDSAYMPGSGTILTGAIAGVGVEDRPELLLFMNVLTEDTCKALSRMIGDKTETIVEDNISNTPLFTGNFSTSIPVAFGTGPTASVYGKREFCYKQTPSGWLSEGVYYFVKVLLER